MPITNLRNSAARLSECEEGASVVIGGEDEDMKTGRFEPNSGLRMKRADLFPRQLDLMLRPKVFFARFPPVDLALTPTRRELATYLTRFPSIGDAPMLRDRRLENALLLIIPLALLAIFLLDILGPPYSGVSVLYVPMILFSSKVLPSRAVIFVGVVCAVFTFASFILASVEGFDMMSAKQFVAILVAIAGTTYLSFAMARGRDLPAEKN